MEDFIHHLLLLFSNVVVAIEDDIRCLKAAFADPQGRLDSWIFENASVGLICKLSGVSCWNAKEDRLISSSDLYDNKISGTIPSQICTWLPNIITLDLSGNQLSGSVPPNLANCTYLNKLRLSSNHLSGQIPYELSSLARLNNFSAAYNNFSGQIPTFKSSFSVASFEGNNGLY
ncbi:hypothetical protein C5167_021188, partial [Papaver somniferum]